MGVCRMLTGLQEVEARGDRGCLTGKRELCAARTACIDPVYVAQHITQDLICAFPITNALANVNRTDSIAGCQRTIGIALTEKRRCSGMGLTERHWFEDEEPELTESQLEDILWENNQIFERGYQKGFSDGKAVILLEQEPVKPADHGAWGGKKCGECGTIFDFCVREDTTVRIGTGYGYVHNRVRYCPWCGRRIKWQD